MSTITVGLRARIIESTDPGAIGTEFIWVMSARQNVAGVRKRGDDAASVGGGLQNSHGSSGRRIHERDRTRR